MHRKMSLNLMPQLTTLIRHNSTTVVKINVGNRIKRGPTDILKALESTIKRDPTAMHYKYADDPYLLPYSNYTKRVYALSKESGRKAAFWIRQEHADLFQHREADPVIQAFLPQVTYNEKKQVSEELLLNTIKHAQLKEAIHIYELLNGEVTDETKLALFEMLCFYNNEEPGSDVLLEEKWLQSKKPEHRLWHDDPEINKLFTYLSTKNSKIASAAYNTMISAYARSYKAEQAQLLVQKCEDKGFILNVHSYNNLIILTQSIDTKMRWEKITELLKKMKSNKIQPNINTLNACLHALSTTYFDQLPTVIRSLLSDFKSIGIEPSLASYYYIITALRKKDQLVNSALQTIVDELEQAGELKIKHPKDTMFFLTAMSVCNQTFDLQLAQRIHDILLYKKNYKFVGDAYKENLYYRNYLLLCLSTTSLVDFTELYQKIVPNVHIPEAKVILEILQTMAHNPPEYIVDLIPLMWSHTVMFDYTNKLNITKKLFDIIHVVSTLLPNDKNLIKEHATIAWKYYELVKEHISTKKKLFNIEASVLGNVLLLLVRNNMFNETIQVFHLIHTFTKRINNIIPEDLLRELLSECIERGHIEAAFYTLEYAVGCEYNEFETLGKRMKTLPLTPKEEKLLNSLLNARTILQERADTKLSNV